MRQYLIKKPHGMSESEKQARIFAVLSVGTRVRILGLLKRRSLCVNALAEVLEITPAAVSQHLRVLRSAEIVIAEKRGYFVHYRVNTKTLADWRKIVCRLLRGEQRDPSTDDKRKSTERAERRRRRWPDSRCEGSKRRT